MANGPRFNQLPKHIQDAAIAAHKKEQAGVMRFTVYRRPSTSEQRQEEAASVLHLLDRLDPILKLVDVRHGEPGTEPDFIFERPNGLIGVELTDLVPKIEAGGHRRRKEFGVFERQNSDTSPAEGRFPWAKYPLRDSLQAVESQLRTKQKKAMRWSSKFPERWLLMHIADGSPFGEIVANSRDMQVQNIPDKEAAFKDHLAQVTYGIQTFCQNALPFDHVILFWGANFLAFPAGTANPHGLPLPSDDLLKHGASLPDSFLDHKRGSTTIIRRNKMIVAGDIQTSTGQSNL